MNTIEFQNGMLRTCSSDSSAILDRLSDPCAHNFMHALAGITDELGELVAASDMPNVWEELGDLLWYLALAYEALGVRFDFSQELWWGEERNGYETNPYYHISQEAFTLFQFTAGLQGIFKAHVFYGRPLDKDLVELRLSRMVKRVFRLCHVSGKRPEVVMELNQKKLRKRFPEKFTEECANVRDLDAERAILEDES